MCPQAILTSGVTHFGATVFSPHPAPSSNLMVGSTNTLPPAWDSHPCEPRSATHRLLIEVGGESTSVALGNARGLGGQSSWIWGCSSHSPSFVLKAVVGEALPVKQVWRDGFQGAAEVQRLMISNKLLSLRTRAWTPEPVPSTTDSIWQPQPPKHKALS